MDSGSSSVAVKTLDKSDLSQFCLMCFQLGQVSEQRRQVNRMDQWEENAEDISIELMGRNHDAIPSPTSHAVQVS